MLSDCINASYLRTFTGPSCEFCCIEVDAIFFVSLAQMLSLVFTASKRTFTLKHKRCLWSENIHYEWNKSTDLKMYTNLLFREFAHSLGVCYYFRSCIKIDRIDDFHIITVIGWHQNTSNNKSVYAILYIRKCYRFIIGLETGAISICAFRQKFYAETRTEVSGWLDRP